MAKEKNLTPFLYETSFENLFLGEYMMDATGKQLKVYLIGQMHSQMAKTVDSQFIASMLKIDLEEVYKIWNYWEGKGLIAKENGDIIFLSLREQLYGNKQKINTGKKALREGDFSEEKKKKQLFNDIEKILGKTLNFNQAEECLDMVYNIGIDPDVVLCGFEYCKRNNKENFSYAKKVILSWHEEGLFTREDVEESQKNRDERYTVYSRVAKSLGFLRNLTENERKLVDNWIDQMNWSLKEILEACDKTSGINSPNINYVNAILENWHERGSKENISKEQNIATKEQIKSYYEYIRNINSRKASKRKQEAVEKVRGLGDLYDKINDLNRKIPQAILQGNNIEKERIRKEINKKEAEIKTLLLKNNIPPDSVEIKYICPICKDTGTLSSGDTCQCYIERSIETLDWLKTI